MSVLFRVESGYPSLGKKKRLNSQSNKWPAGMRGQGEGSSSTHSSFFGYQARAGGRVAP